MDRLQSLLSDGEKRAKLFRWFWIISLLFLLLGYVIILLRIL